MLGRTLRAGGIFAKTVATMGGSQNFLNRAWVPWLLRTTPGSARRRVALEILALSPHYFLTPPSAEKSRQEWLLAECERNRRSREELADSVLAPFLEPAATVLDYGCGPGFLA